MEKRDITLPNGNNLEVYITPKFLDAVRKQLSLPESESITDSHIRIFIHECTSRAIENAILEQDSQ